MDIQYTLSFRGEPETLKEVEQKLQEGDLIDDMVESMDHLSISCSDNLMYIVHSGDSSWVNVSTVLERLDLDVDVILTSTDGKSFVDIVSTSGTYDSFCNDNHTHCVELCSLYGLEFYDSSYEDDDEDDMNDDDYDENY